MVPTNPVGSPTLPTHDPSDLMHPFMSALRANLRQIRTVLVVVLLHIAAFGVLSQMPGAWRHAVATQRAITVFLLDDIPATASLPVKTVKQAMPQRASAPVVVSADTPQSVSPTPAPAPAAGAASLTAPSPREAGVSEAPGAAPLNLQLSPGWSPPSAPRHPALESGQGQRQTLTLERRLAGALGDGHWTEERLGDGRLRLRNGNRCVYLQRNRSDELNPFNATPTPWTANQQAC